MSKFHNRFKNNDKPAVAEWRHKLKWAPNISGLFDEMPQSEVYENLSEPTFEVPKGTRKILFVLDWVPTEDLYNHKVMSGITGDLLINLIRVAKTVYLKGQSHHFGWRATTYSACRTVGKSPAAQNFLHTLFLKRLKRTINDYKPDVIICFGSQSSTALISEKVESTKKVAPWLGVPIKVSMYRGHHDTLVVPSASLTNIIQGGKQTAYLLGYIARHVANAIAAEHRYAIDDKVVRNHKAVYIDTLPKFKKLMTVMKGSKVASIDTETQNLNKVTNRLLTIQFAKCEKYGYMVPIYHKDTPFSPKELKVIKRELGGYFEGDNDNEYHIYANAKFDLLVMSAYLGPGINYFKNDLWDVFGGEFALDENLGNLTNISDGGYYSLGNLAIQYGTEVYLDAAFSKADRGSIAHTDMSPKLVRYGTTDVIVPLMMHYKQIERAKDLGYGKYKKVVTNQISDTIHGLAKMERWGSGVDLDYLFYLNTPASPIEAELKLMEGKFLSSPAIKKANQILAKRMGVTNSKGLFASKSAKSLTEKMYFSRRTQEHMQVLFFDVLQLEPLSFGKAMSKDGNKVGKIDKAFKAEYASVPEVGSYTSLVKAEKLRDAYVKSFMNLLRDSDDFRYDHRIRPSYGYLKVVTYRTNARDPNLQQIPSRSALGKHIKRLFIARVGGLYVKVDYRVHEVRCWGIISGDDNIAKLFVNGAKLWAEYRALPTEDMLKRLKFEADIHVVNVMYFFSKTLKELINDPDLLKDLRDGVKSVTFGIIYQMSVASLAEQIKKAVEYTQGIYDGFVKRFPKAIGWNESQKRNAQTKYYVEAPIGIRRNLFGYILPKFKSEKGDRHFINTQAVHGDMDRRAVNSPVQGLGAQCMSIGNRNLDHMIQEQKVKYDREVGLYTNNSVHDSLENEALYKDLILSLDFIERALTTEVAAKLKSRYGMEINSMLAIDFEIGATLSDLHKWDFSVPQLEEIVEKSLEFQKKELGRDINIQKTMKEIFSQKDDMPKWMKRQIKTLGFKFKHEK